MADGLGDAAATSLDAAPGLITALDDYRAPKILANPLEWATGYAPSGINLGDWSMRPVINALSAIKQGTPPLTALYWSRQLLTMQTALAVMDAANQASAVDVATRPQTGFIRIVEPGACARCLIMAGRFYRFNEGFLRHPRCKCRHVPAVDRDSVRKELQDPRAAFDAMSHEEQNTAFGKAGAEAIRLGADIGQVVRARRGMEPVGRGKFTGPRRTVMTTTEGMGRYGWTRIIGGKKRRLTPEAIMQLVGNDRERTIKALTDNGYILPHDWKQQLYDKRTTLLKRKRYNRPELTQTAAQERLQKSQLRYDSLREKFENGDAVNLKDLAQAERDYRRWAETAGEVFVK